MDKQAQYNAAVQAAMNQAYPTSAATPSLGSILQGQAGQYMGQSYPTSTINPNQIHMQQGDIVIRAVRNGFTAEVYLPSGQNPTYVAESLESLFDAIKLAMVNHKLDEARPEK